MLVDGMSQVSSETLATLTWNSTRDKNFFEGVNVVCVLVNLATCGLIVFWP